jgi:putative peptidoglycan lipid II flippase
MKSHDLFRASSIMALGTIISRIAGFIRSILTVAVLGTALLADTFNVANTMPNIIYNLMVGGALTAIFVPQLVKAMDHADEGSDFASRLLTTISTILLGLTLVGIIFAPWLVRIYAPEFATPGFEREYQISIEFMRYCLPQIFFLGIFTMLGQIANARGSFAPLMWAPIANNIVGILLMGSFLVFIPKFNAQTITSGQVQLLGLGTTLGVVAQALVLIPAVRRTNFHLKIRFGLHGLGKSFSLAGWTLVYVLISQLGYLITVQVATSAAVRSAKAGISTGVGITPYTNAYFVFLLPYSIVTISLITALLPHISKLAHTGKIVEVREEIIRAIRTVSVITIPAGTAFFLFGPLISRTIFMSLSVEDGNYLGYVLSGLGVGLATFSINIILVRAFNAFEDTKTQVPSILFINLISVGLSYLFLFTLPSKWVTVGLAAAFSISYLIGLPYTLHLLKRHTGKIHLSEFVPQHLTLTLASILVFAPIYLITRWVGEVSGIIRVVELLLVMVLGAGGYFFVARALKVAEVATFTQFVRKVLPK